MRTAIIPARGGSRRIPRKNVARFMGKPMLLYPIEAAQASGLFDLIVVSTDDFEIADVAFQAGAVVMPRPLDDGSTGTQELAGMVLDQLDIDAGSVCVIYPCSPMLEPADLLAGLESLRPVVNFAMSVGPDGQDAGCFYWGWAREFRKRSPLDLLTVKVPLPAERCIDINTPDDLAKAHVMFTALRRAS